MLKNFLILWMAIFLICASFIKNNIHDIIANAKVEFKYYSSDWNLTPAQWKQYITIMQGPNGHYYPNIIPFRALGVDIKKYE